MLILLFFWQAANEPSKEIVLSGGWLIFYMFLSTIAGAFLKSLGDYVFNRSKVDSEIVQQQADTHLSDSLTRKNDNDIIISLQGQLVSEQRLRMDMQRLLLDMQDRLDGWIRKFQEASDEASQMDEELRQMRQICDDCVSGRKDYFEFCEEIKTFFDQILPVIERIEDQTLLRDMNDLKRTLNHLQVAFEKEMKLIDLIASKR